MFFLSVCLFCFVLPAPRTPVQSQIFGLGLPMAGSPAPSLVSPRRRSMTAGSDNCTVCLHVDRQGQAEWHMTTAGLDGVPTSQDVGTKPPKRKFWFLVDKTRVS